MSSSGRRLIPILRSVSLASAIIAAACTSPPHVHPRKGEQAAGRLLGIAPPVVVSSIGACADGGSIILTMTDASNTEHSIWVGYGMGQEEGYGAISIDTESLTKGAEKEFALGVILQTWLISAVGPANAYRVLTQINEEGSNPSFRSLGYIGDPDHLIWVGIVLAQIERNQLGAKPRWREVTVAPDPDFGSTNAWTCEWTYEEDAQPCHRAYR
jgi:hypothetical protein